MDRDSYVEGIRSAWLGEQFGEIFFAKLAAKSQDKTLESKWQLLAKLEHVTGSKMAKLLDAHEEPYATDDPIEVDDSLIDQYANSSHHDAMLRMQDVLEKAIVRFDQLLAVAPEEDVPAVQFLVQHELALLSFVEREVAGQGDSSLQAVEQLLQQA